MSPRLLILWGFSFIFCCGSDVCSASTAVKEAAFMQIKSSAFADNQPIPVQYTCDGNDLSPPLAFENVPANAKSLAVIVEDPDAPSGTFDHWVAWNIPATTKSLEEGAQVPRQGKNHYNNNKYRGPCPPRGSEPHRYYFKLYALDRMLNLPAGSSKKQLEAAMEGKILAKSELIGTFKH